MKPEPPIIRRNPLIAPVITHGDGQAFTHLGKTWYSPNAVAFPSEISDPPFQFSDATRLQELRTARPWDPYRPWLPFIPTEEDIDLCDVCDLDEIEIITKRERRPFCNVEQTYQLAPPILEIWMDLEWACNLIISIFNSKDPMSRVITGVAPPTPSGSTGYQRAHNTPRAAKVACELAREKFILNLSYISYLISTQPDHGSPKPVWYEACLSHNQSLRNRGVPQRILAGIKNSYLSEFSKAVPCAGVLRDVTGPHKGDPPDIHFYYQRGVPVWYIWMPNWPRNHLGPEEMCPPPNIIQCAQPFTPFVPPTVSSLDARPWREFFKNRYRIYREHPGTLEQEEAWAKSQETPPLSRVAGMKVFRWVPNGDTLVRKPVDPRYFVGTLQHHKDRQRWFDARSREWDVCSWFSISWDAVRAMRDLAYEEEGGDRLEIEDMPHDHPHDEQAQTDFVVGEFAAVDQHTSLLQVHQILDERFGFTPDYSATGVYVPTKEATASDWERVPRALCMLDDGMPPNAGAMCDFIRGTQLKHNKMAVQGRSLQTQDTPPWQIWDIDPRNPRHTQLLQFRGRVIRHSPISTVYLYDSAPSEADASEDSEEEGEIRDVEDPWYELRLANGPTEWSLHLTTALDTLHCLRWNASGLSPDQILQRISYSCIPFSTRTTIVAQNPPPVPTSWLPAGPRLQQSRWYDYIFDLQDYYQYEHTVRAVLRSPRSRAAFLVGGIVARRARDLLSADLVFDGPSQEVTKYQIGARLNASGTWDDTITKEELDGICGLIIVHGQTRSGDGQQQALKSWWPRHETWMSASTGMNPGYWSPECEKWYLQRQADIHAGRAEPLSSTEWRTALKRNRHSRDLRIHSERSAQQLLSQLIVERPFTPPTDFSDAPFEPSTTDMDVDLAPPVDIELLEAAPVDMEQLDEHCMFAAATAEWERSEWDRLGSLYPIPSQRFAAWEKVSARREAWDRNYQIEHFGLLDRLWENREWERLGNIYPKLREAPTKEKEMNKLLRKRLQSDEWRERKTEWEKGHQAWSAREWNRLESCYQQTLDETVDNHMKVMGGTEWERLTRERNERAVARMVQWPRRKEYVYV